MSFGLTAQGIGSLIGAGSSIFGAATANSNYKKNIKAQKELMGMQHKYNEQSAEEAYRREKEMYERTYEDSSYVNQMNRMRDAGLNVGLMYSGGKTSGGGSGQIGGGSQAAGSGLPTAPDAMGKTQAYQQMGVSMQQAAATMADVELKKAQARNLDADTQQKSGPQTDNIRSQTAVNWQTVQNLVGEAEGQKLKNAFQSVENYIAENSKDLKLEGLEYEVDILFEESEAAYERKLQSIEDTEMKQAFTIEYIEQQALLTKQMAVDLIQKVTQVELTEAQIYAVYKGLELQAEGNAIRWDQNRIQELLGTLGIERAFQGSLLGALTTIGQGAITLLGTTRIARAMMGSARTAAAARTAGKAAGLDKIVRTYNAAGILKSVTETSQTTY